MTAGGSRSGATDRTHGDLNGEDSDTLPQVPDLHWQINAAAEKAAAQRSFNLRNGVKVTWFPASE
jgi:hypothetical protein